MHVGMGVIFQATDHKRTDHEVYANELKLGDLAEPLGFDSLWGEIGRASCRERV